MGIFIFMKIFVLNINIGNMSKNSFYFLLTSFLLNFGCKKSTENAVQNIVNTSIDVSKYTSTDVAGASLGLIDNTDWTFDNTWNSAENALMQTPTAAQLLNTETATVTLYPSYPNPLMEVFAWGFKTTKTTLLQTVVTDSLLNIKMRNFTTTNIGSNALAFLLTANDYTNNKNYRFYYGFYSLAAGLYYKGHGDLAVRR
jgi:hypothetical protein